MSGILSVLRYNALCLVLFLSGCQSGPEEVVLNYKNLKPGSQVWYRIILKDSLAGPEDIAERKQSDRFIRFTVQDTMSSGLNIEWWEQHWMPYERSVGQPHGEWVSMYRIEYHVNEHGDIETVLNYPDLRSQIDPLMDTYLSQIDSATGSYLKPFAQGFLDSSRVVNSLLTDAMIIHRLHGLSLSKHDTISLLTYLEDTNEYTPYFIVMQDHVICEKENISLLGWSSPLRMDIEEFLREKDLIMPDLDTIKLDKVRATEQMLACFDTTLSLPAYIEYKRSMEINARTMIQYRLIYLVE